MNAIQMSSRRPDRHVAGLILAGGLSRRLGFPKQLLPYGAGTLLEHAIRQVEAVREIDPLIVVLPPGEPVPEPKHARARIVRRADDDGCSASLRAGIDALPEGIEALVILPADQPGLTPDFIRASVTAWCRAHPPALTASYRGTPGHPLVFSAALLPELMALRGEKAMWWLLERLGGNVVRVEIDAELPEDVDTPEDVARRLGLRVGGP
jgi:molybdenum cofactor cytidylyltransferase